MYHVSCCSDGSRMSLRPKSTMIDATAFLSSRSSRPSPHQSPLREGRMTAVCPPSLRGSGCEITRVLEWRHGSIVVDCDSHASNRLPRVSVIRDYNHGAEPRREHILAVPHVRRDLERLSTKAESGAAVSCPQTLLSARPDAVHRGHRPRVGRCADHSQTAYARCREPGPSRPHE